MRQPKAFFVLGDDWGLIEIVPRENRAFYEEVARQQAQHHKDTVFSPNGWSTPPFFLPSPQVSLAARSLTGEDVEQAFVGVLKRAEGVQSCEGCMGAVWDCPDTFAFYPGEANVSRGLYGAINNGIVTELYATSPFYDADTAARLAHALVGFGTRYDLILVSHGSEIVDLTDEEAVNRYLRDEEDEEDEEDDD